MPLTTKSLSDKMLANLKKTFKPDDDTNLKALCDAYADAIVDEITSNAIVTSSAIKVDGGMSGLTPYNGPVISAVVTLTDGKIK
jgi:hypothetical protein